MNNTTVLQAPSKSVKEIGRVLPCLLHYMHDTPKGLHILFYKLDISDMFWRLIIRKEDSFNFAYVLPQWKGEPVRIVVPLAVQMGWVKSTLLFCTVYTNAELPLHLFESEMKIQHMALRAHADTPSKLLQVYVDDFCYASMESKDGCHILQIRRTYIHGIHSYFPEPE